MKILKKVSDFFGGIFDAICEARMQQAKQHLRFHEKGFFHHWE